MGRKQLPRSSLPSQRLQSLRPARVIWPVPRPPSRNLSPWARSLTSWQSRATTTNRSNAVTLARPKQLKFWHRWVRRHSLLPNRRSFKFTSFAIATRKDPLLFWHSQLYDVRWLVAADVRRTQFKHPQQKCGREQGWHVM